MQKIAYCCLLMYVNFLSNFFKSGIYFNAGIFNRSNFFKLCQQMFVIIRCTYKELKENKYISIHEQGVLCVRRGMTSWPVSISNQIVSP